MVVALDATPLVLTSGGIRRYTEELAIALAELSPEDQIHLVSDQPFCEPRSHPGNLHLHYPSAPRNILERRWWLLGLPLCLIRLQANVFHGTNFCVPYVPLCPSVMTLHDLSPWLEGEWTNTAWRQTSGRIRTRTPFQLRATLTRMIIVPSEAIRSSAIERFGLHPGNVIATPEAASAAFRPCAGYELGAPYFLLVGTLERRKNVLMALEAWRLLKAKGFDVDLIVVGRRRDDFAKLQEEPGLHVLGEVNDTRLPALYSGCLASLYPSLYEGFGLPVLEAMQCGAAVITSCDPALLELSGGSALHAEATDVRGWAAAMSRIASDGEIRRQHRDLSLKRSACYSWAKTALATKEVYDEAIRRFRQ